MKRFEATVQCRKFDQDFITSANQYIKSKGLSNMLIRIEDLKGVKSSDLAKLDSRIQVRVAGGYKQNIIDNLGKVVYVNGETGQYFTDAVIYSRNELIKIVEEMEKIEKGINEHWSQEQKTIYLYERIKSLILYDPQYENKPSSEIRSLRGLITKNSVCAGYSMIFKEFMDRQGITCRYVSGYTNSGEAHAWNVVTINGKNYGFDLTWDTGRHSGGNFKAIDYMGTNSKEFAKTHKPRDFFDIQNYEETLSNFDKEVVAKMRNEILKNNSFDKTRFYGQRTDGSRYMVAQIGDSIIGGKRIFRYVYSDVLSNGTVSDPIIVYSGTNVIKYVDASYYNYSTPDNWRHSIDNVLFSKKNINDAISNGTCYIGDVNIYNKDTKEYEMCKDVDTLREDNNKESIKTLRERLNFPTFSYKRSDGSTIVIQQMLTEPKEILLERYMQYNIVEISKSGGVDHIEFKNIITESKLDKLSQEAVDKFLSHERIDECIKNNSGYIGYYKQKSIHYHNEYLDYLRNNESKTYEDEKKKKGLKDALPVLELPSFQELRKYAEMYEVKDVVDDKAIIVEKQSKALVDDKKTYDIALFAHIWSMAMGIKFLDGKDRIEYAFNKGSEEVYDFITRSAFHDLTNKGQIDTVAMIRNADLLNYKHCSEAIVRLFSSPFQTNAVDTFYRRREAFANTKKSSPEPLYNLPYAGETRNARFGEENIVSEVRDEYVYHYPGDDKMKNLYSKKKEAAAKGDRNLVSKYADEMVRTLKQIPVSISDEVYDKMLPKEKLSYINYKIKEAGVLQKKRDAEYWKCEKEYYTYLVELRAKNYRLNNDYASLMNELDKENVVDLLSELETRESVDNIEETYGYASGFGR